MEKPRKRKAMPQRLCSATLPKAKKYLEALNSSLVSNMNVENVVNAPMKPVRSTVRSIEAWEKRASTNAHTAPKRKDPAMFTVKVPHGKLIPAERWTKEPSQYRAMVPTAPATAIRSIFDEESDMRVIRLFIQFPTGESKSFYNTVRAGVQGFSQGTKHPLSRAKKQPKFKASGYNDGKCAFEKKYWTLQNGIMDLSALYSGLEFLVKSTFPKECRTCGRVYATADEFLKETRSIEGSSGLKASFDQDDSTLVELFRNCVCGSTLMEVCRDRRDTSEAGLRRRQKFGELIEILINKGIERDAARIELLKFMHGQESGIVKAMLQKDRLAPHLNPLPVGEREG